MKILVTGGAGFIGSNFILYLLKKHPEDSVICVDKLTYAGNLENLDAVRDSQRFSFEKTDICDREKIYEIFERERPDAVVNFAAESHVDRSIENPEIFLKSNILGTAVLMDACLKFGDVRFHQISTDEVYGELPEDRPDLMFSEESPIRPNSPYSVSKASADMLVLSYIRTYRLRATISRCSNNYGPFQLAEKLIPRMIASCIRGEKLPVYGDGMNVRDWIYVEDHGSAVDLILRRGVIGEIYNVGSRCEMKNLDLVRLIAARFKGCDTQIVFTEDRKGHDRRYAVDPSKIEKELGWRPATKLREGLESTVNWYLDNRSWWDRPDTM